MQIQINTDHNIEGNEGLSNHVQSEVEHGLDHLRSHITRIEVHLSEETGRKGSDNEKRCVMEARLEHHQPVVVTHHAANVHQAIEGAVSKLLRMLESTIERYRDQKTRSESAIVADPTIPEE